MQVTLQREWKALERTAELRRAAAGRLLKHLLDSLPPGSRGTDRLAETTLGKLLTAVKSDMNLASDVRDHARLTDRALLWLHEQEVIRLNRGLTVFRPAMTIRLKPGRRGFARADFASLKLHYDESGPTDTRDGRVRAAGPWSNGGCGTTCHGLFQPPAGRTF